GGKLGSGDSLPFRVIPVPVAGGLTFAAIDAGIGYSCGVTIGGDAYCWGTGPLGNASASASSVPMLVDGGLHFTTVSAGWEHSCALAASGAAYCWGSDGVMGTGVSQPSQV